MTKEVDKKMKCPHGHDQVMVVNCPQCWAKMIKQTQAKAIFTERKRIKKEIEKLDWG